MRNIFSVCAAGAAILTGCGAPDQTSSGAPTSPHAIPAGLLAQPCPLPLATDDAGPLSANVRVFIEIAAFDGNMAERIAKSGPAIARSFSEWLNDPSSGVRRVGGILATAETVAKMPLDGAGGDTGSDAGAIRRWDLAITPHVADPRSSEVRMEIIVEPAPPLGTPEGSWSIPDHRRAHTTLVMTDQKPTVISLDPAVMGVETGRGWTLLLTPYLIRRDDDLRRLFECRMANRSRVAR